MKAEERDAWRWQPLPITTRDMSKMSKELEGKDLLADAKSKASQSTPYDLIPSRIGGCYNCFIYVAGDPLVLESPIGANFT